MSHFTVLVVGADIKEQLAPFHEFECTGFNDEHVIEEDKTAEEYEDYTTKKKWMIRLADGELREYYSDEFYRDPTLEEQNQIGPMAGSCGYREGLSFSSKDWNDGLGYRPKIHFIPEGCEKVEVPYNQLMSFEEFLIKQGYNEVMDGCEPDIEGDHKYNYFKVDELGPKVVRRTNPNRKWDWWAIGGRWSNILKLRSGEKVNSCVMKELDIEGIREEASLEAEEFWERVHAFTDQYPPLISWEEIRSKQPDRDKAREEYWGQEVAKALANSDDRDFKWLLSDGENVLLLSKEEYIKSRELGAFRTFALVKDKTWYERGRMGWFGCVSDEKDNWDTTFSELVSQIDPDEIITVVDCHI